MATREDDETLPRGPSPGPWGPPWQDDESGLWGVEGLDLDQGMDRGGAAFTKADSALIAAAPEMLELLRRWIAAQDAWAHERRAIMTTEEWERDVRPLLDRIDKAGT